MENYGVSDTTQKRHEKPNRLINEKSPYLLQHAYNPVDWYSWGDEAFEAATRLDKPVFLSIGYSTCHWCHVMERESFEDEQVAALMNETFVSVKVDREERPDLDHIYMTVCQLMTGSGGWPLNVILTPQKEPFFAGTYFPKESGFGRIGMMDLTARVGDLWTNSREQVLISAKQLLGAVKQIPQDFPGKIPGTRTLEQAFLQLQERYDGALGGFGPAPKFPTPHNFYFLLRYWKRTGDDKALAMVVETLKAIRNGGIYDHIGFGFHRYSTDNEWLLPHFEKMLYDQALLSMAYIEAFQATGLPEFAQTGSETIDYVLRDMTSNEGGFFSAEDADSEGIEGKFYVWTLEEIEEVLGSEDALLFARVFNLERAGNFHDEATGKLTGSNILHMNKPLGETARDFGLSEQEVKTRIAGSRIKLFEVREKRIHPHKDDKILTDWNGLMIAALAKAAQVLDREDYAKAAEKAADFILDSMHSEDGRLLHRYRAGESALSATIDDYAFFIWGLIELYEATFKVKYLLHALDLNAQLQDLFWDAGVGGFFYSPIDAADLLMRKKDVYDGATPSGNSVAVLNLLRLSGMTGRTDLGQRAQAVAGAFSGNVKQFPSGYTQMLSALEFLTGTSQEVVVSGRPGAEDTDLMLKTLRREFLPNKVVLFRPSADHESEITALAPFTKDQISIDGKATAYVCRNQSCELPTSDCDRMMELVSNSERKMR